MASKKRRYADSVGVKRRLCDSRGFRAVLKAVISSSFIAL